jgi:membrane-bound serine protease (ClpP class)
MPIVLTTPFPRTCGKRTSCVPVSGHRLRQACEGSLPKHCADTRLPVGPGRATALRWVWHGLFVLLLAFAVPAASALAAQGADNAVPKPPGAQVPAKAAPGRAEGPPLVFVAGIEGIIDLGLAPYVQRVIREAHAAGADAVVLEINTFGGRVDAAVQIRDALLDSPVKTIAFVNKRAISAGALITLASERVAMAGGSTIGAATPVQAGQPGAAAQPVAEKTVSYVRKEFRATAESRGRPPLIAEAMVDADVVIRGVIEKGKLLTLTTDEALKQKVADVRADTLQDALKQFGLEGAELQRVSKNWAEEVVRVLTHPVVSSLLITVAMLGIIVELRTPGFGVPGALGVGSLSLFLWGHWLVQLAGWEELLLVLAGLVLLAVEAFVLPGFGLAGILGGTAVLAALVLSMVGPGHTTQFLMITGTRVGFAMVLAIGIGLLLMRWLPRLPFGRQLVLDTAMDSAQGYVSAPQADTLLLGRRGRAATPLHPAGIAEIDGQRVDVVSDGEPVDSGEPVEVIRVDGNRVVVRRMMKTNDKE